MFPFTTCDGAIDILPSGARLVPPHRGIIPTSPLTESHRQRSDRLLVILGRGCAWKIRGRPLLPLKRGCVRPLSLHPSCHSFMYLQ